MASESRGISLDSDVWKWLESWAQKEGRSLSNAVERIIKTRIASQEEPKKSE